MAGTTGTGSFRALKSLESFEGWERRKGSQPGRNEAFPGCVRPGTNLYDVKLSCAISMMERSSLLMAFAVASTSGSTCLMKYFAVLTLPS